LQAAENRLPESVVLIDHADFVDYEHVPEIIHLFPGFIVIRRADIHYIMFQRRVEHFRAGEEPDHGNFIGFSQRNILGGRWRADKKSRTENAFFLQTLKAVFRIRRLVAIIEGQKLDLAAKHSTFRIYVIEVGRGADNRLQTQKPGGAIQCRT